MKSKQKKSVKNRNSAKQRIQKSDEIIVVAKTPIEEIIQESSIAKEIKSALKKIHAPEKETLDRKIKDVKARKISGKSQDVYLHAKKILADAYSNGFYLSEDSKLDYGKLFSYFSTKSGNPLSVYESRDTASSNSNKEIVSDRELTAYVDKLMLLSLVGGINDSSFEEKEKMRYFSMFNRSRVSMKVNLSAYKLTDNIDLDRSV